MYAVTNLKSLVTKSLVEKSLSRKVCFHCTTYLYLDNIININCIMALNISNIFCYILRIASVIGAIIHINQTVVIHNCDHE